MCHCHGTVNKYKQAAFVIDFVYLQKNLIVLIGSVLSNDCSRHLGFHIRSWRESGQILSRAVIRRECCSLVGYTTMSHLELDLVTNSSMFGCSDLKPYHFGPNTFQTPKPKAVKIVTIKVAEHGLY